MISAQHGLVKVSYATRKAYRFFFLFTRNKVEEANKTVAKVLEWKMVQGVSIVSSCQTTFSILLYGAEVRLQVL